MTFHFRFEAMLKRQEGLFQEARMAFARARRKVLELQECKSRFRNDIWKQKELLADQQRRGMNVSYYLAFTEHLACLEHKLHTLEEELLRARKDLDHKHQELLACEMQLKQLEHLKTRDLEAYRNGVRKAEQKRLDELAGGRGVRAQDESQI
ncbi:MAG: flagellar FliJ family protein [Thermodesulfobacteriota bacterium]|nr:flagellar FliJ family protein [Thermodesulfobacteriota bacterium]